MLWKLSLRYRPILGTIVTEKWNESAPPVLRTSLHEFYGNHSQNYTDIRIYQLVHNNMFKMYTIDYVTCKINKIMYINMHNNYYKIYHSCYVDKTYGERKNT